MSKEDVMLTGLITSEIIFTVILTLGLTMLILELFVPSFGLLGISGIYLVIESFLAINNIDNAMLYIIISLIASAIIGMIIGKIFFRNMEKNKLVLNKSFNDIKGNNLQHTVNKEELLNEIAVVNKVLRPSGTIELNGTIYNAVSNGSFISKGKKVIIERIENSQLYVREIEEDQC